MDNSKSLDESPRRADGMWRFCGAADDCKKHHADRHSSVAPDPICRLGELSLGWGGKLSGNRSRRSNGSPGSYGHCRLRYRTRPAVPIIAGGAASSTDHRLWPCAGGEATTAPATAEFQRDAAGTPRHAVITRSCIEVTKTSGLDFFWTHKKRIRTATHQPKSEGGPARFERGPLRCRVQLESW